MENFQTDPDKGRTIWFYSSNNETTTDSSKDLAGLKETESQKKITEIGRAFLSDLKKSIGNTLIRKPKVFLSSKLQSLIFDNANLDSNPATKPKLDATTKPKLDTDTQRLQTHLNALTIAIEDYKKELHQAYEENEIEYSRKIKNLELEMSKPINLKSEEIGKMLSAIEQRKLLYKPYQGKIDEIRSELKTLEKNILTEKEAYQSEPESEKKSKIGFKIRSDLDLIEEKKSQLQELNNEFEKFKKTEEEDPSPDIFKGTYLERNKHESLEMYEEKMSFYITSETEKVSSLEKELEEKKEALKLDHKKKVEEIREKFLPPLVAKRKEWQETNIVLNRHLNEMKKFGLHKKNSYKQLINSQEKVEKTIQDFNKNEKGHDYYKFNKYQQFISQNLPSNILEIKHTKMAEVKNEMQKLEALLQKAQAADDSELVDKIKKFQAEVEASPNYLSVNLLKKQSGVDLLKYIQAANACILANAKDQKNAHIESFEFGKGRHQLALLDKAIEPKTYEIASPSEKNNDQKLITSQLEETRLHLVYFFENFKESHLKTNPGLSKNFSSLIQAYKDKKNFNPDISEKSAQNLIQDLKTLSTALQMLEEEILFSEEKFQLDNINTEEIKLEVTTTETTSPSYSDVWKNLVKPENEDFRSKFLETYHFVLGGSFQEKFLDRNLEQSIKEPAKASHNLFLLINKEFAHASFSERSQILKLVEKWLKDSRLNDGEFTDPAISFEIGKLILEAKNTHSPTLIESAIKIEELSRKPVYSSSQVSTIAVNSNEMDTINSVIKKVAKGKMKSADYETLCKNWALQLSKQAAFDFQSISFSEFATHKEGSSDHIGEMIQHGTALSNFIESQILSYENLDQRVRVMTFFIDIQYELLGRDQNKNKIMVDFNTAWAIHTGLTKTSIYRLDKTKNNLSKDTQEKAASAGKLFSADHNFTNYYNQLKASPMSIPFLGRILTDFTMVLERTPLIKNPTNQLNTARIMNLGAITSRIKTAHLPSDLKNRALKPIFETTPVDENRSYQKSLELEPRQEN